MFEPWGWENEANARAYVQPYKHVFVARIDSHKWGETKPGRLTPRYFSGTVTKTYKGNWKPGEKISFVHYVDEPEPVEPNSSEHPGELMVIFARNYTQEELMLETGEFVTLRPNLIAALEYLYPQRK